MNKKLIQHKNFSIDKYSSSKSIKKSFDKILDHIFKQIDSTKDTYHFLSNKFQFNFKINDFKRFKKFQNIVIVGMGGSSLGSNAIYEFLKFKIKKNVIFFDNLEKEKINNFKKSYDSKKSLFIIISKSGNTIETISTFFELSILKNKAKNIIIISEKNNNILYSISKKYKLMFIEHKKYLGGRYSVLSEVGMVPSYLMGINIKKIRKNLKNYLAKDKKILKSGSIFLSQIISQKKFKNLIFLNYSPKLEKFLFWLQQLIAESLGKNGKGILPIVSNCPKDHHSVLQLYLDGPQDKMFYFFSEATTKYKSEKKKKFSYRKYFNNNSLDKIKNSQMRALKTILIKNKAPVREFILDSSSEETLGELFTYFILETSIAGRLINLNPFDQPAVEQVKSLTKKILN